MENKETLTAPAEPTVEAPKEETLEDIQRQIKELEQDNLAKAKERLAQLKAEAQQYTFPKATKQVENKKEVEEVNKNPLELIEEEFQRINFAINNYPSGHPARAPYPKETEYLGIPLIKAFARWADGEKLEDIFNHPINNFQQRLNKVL